MQKITTFLWFDDAAEEAVNFYVSVFKNAKVLNITRYGKEGPGPEGSVMTVKFELFGQQFLALNGGPHFEFTEAISLLVSCDTQEEIDYYWEQLKADGGKESMCGWLKDKYGLSWQVAPVIMGKLMSGEDKNKTGSAIQAMMQMKKLDIKKLQEAYDAG